MSRHILIVEDQPIIASKNAIMQRAKEAFGGLSWETLVRFDDEKRKAEGIHINVQVHTVPLLEYQKHSPKVAKWDGTDSWLEVSSVDLSLENAKDLALASLASKRWQVETGGTYVGQVFIDTRREVIGIVSHHYHKAQADPDHTVDNFKVGKCVFANLNATMIIGIANAFEAHVQACFTRESELSSEVAAAADLDALRAIDMDSGWPSNDPPEE